MGEGTLGAALNWSGRGGRDFSLDVQEGMDPEAEVHHSSKIV